MKIGIISDIHGNFKAMKKALSILDRYEVDTILCAGDLVDGENETDLVVSLLRERNITCVQGNHDSEVFGEQAQLRRLMKQSGITEHDFLLDSSTVAYLSLLPLKYEFEVSNTKICLAHGVPESNFSYLFPESSSHKFFDVTQQTNADIIILGHTHVPMNVKCNETIIINVGSVHQNRYEINRTCGVLKLDDLSLVVFDIDNSNPIAIQRKVIEI